MILVTGANGHIGNHIVKNLLRHGYRLKALCRPGSNRKALENLKGNFEITEGNILDSESLTAALDGCKIVIHTAAVYSTDPSRKKEILKTAIEGSLNIAKASLKAGIQKLVYTSSVAAVGSSPNPSRLLDETSWNEAPGSPYVEAKLKAERSLLSFAQREKLPLVTVCPATVIGAEDFRITPSNAIIAKLHTMSFYLPGGINLTGVEDIAEGHRLALENGKPFERYILSNANMKFREIADQIDFLLGEKHARFPLPMLFFQAAGLGFDVLSALTGKTMPLSLKSANTYLGRYHFYSNEKAKRELGFHPGPIDIALWETIEWAQRLSNRRGTR